MAWLEGIEIKLIKKGDQIPENTQNPFIYPGYIYYSTHVQDYGWLSNIGDGKTSGTSGQSKRVEAIKVSLCNLPYSGSVEYSTHIQDIGWQSYRRNGSISGTSGQSKRVEAIKIKLTGEISNYYDVYYRVHAQDLGWMSWTCNDSKAGTEGLELRVEAIQLKKVEMRLEIFLDLLLNKEKWNIVHMYKILDGKIMLIMVIQVEL